MISQKEYSLIFKDKKHNKISFHRTMKYLGLFVFLFTFFYFSLNYSAYYKKLTFTYFNTKVETLNADPKVETTTVKPTPTARVYIPNLANNNITIPSLKITAPVAWNTPLADIYKKLESGTVHLDTNATPDIKGNVFIFGHSSNYAWAPGSYNQIFATLPNIKIDNDVVVNYNNQQFLYRVKRIKTVSPKDVSVLNPTPIPTLTLMTCVPVGTSLNRLIIQAELVEGLVYDDPIHQNLNLDYLPKVI